MLNHDPLSFRAQSVNHALPELLHRLLAEKTRTSRNGAMKELGPVSITIEKPWLRYVSVPERKVSLPAQIAETMWVLAGRNDVEWLSHYLPRARDFSDDGLTWAGGYGPRLRAWPCRPGVSLAGKHFVSSEDQLWHVVELLREDVETRRAVISLYDPARDTRDGLKDVPCNNWLSFRVGNDGRLHLNVATRSNDIMWGWSGINTFEWSALLAVVCALTGLAQGTIRYNITSLHLYERHFLRAQRIVNAANVDLPQLEDQGPRFTSLGPGTTRRSFDSVLRQWFTVEGQIREGHPDAETNVAHFPDALLRQWLQALRSWHLGLRPAPSTHLNAALAYSPAFKGHRAPEAEKAPENPLLDTLVALHKEKDAVYGDSWCRRGEQVSILANIARKVDRLGKAGAGDTELDTAMDLTIYLVKYRLWLADHGMAVTPGGVRHSGAEGEKFHEGHQYVEQRLRKMAAELDYSWIPGDDLPAKMIAFIQVDFESLLSAADEFDCYWTTGDDLPAKMIAYLQQDFESLLSAADAGGPRGLHAVSLEQWSFYYTSLVWHQQQVQKKRERLDEKRATQRFDGYARAGEEESE